MSTATGEVIDRAKRVLGRHPVTFAMLFGSAARDDAGSPGDVDVAVEFEEHARGDGYSDALLALVDDLESALGEDVDVVPVSSMSPVFAAIAFEDGVVLVGTEIRREELARSVAGDAPTTAEAVERVAAAAGRLRDESE